MVDLTLIKTILSTIMLVTLIISGGFISINLLIYKYYSLAQRKWFINYAKLYIPFMLISLVYFSFFL